MGCCQSKPKTVRQRQNLERKAETNIVNVELTTVTNVLVENEDDFDELDLVPLSAMKDAKIRFDDDDEVDSDDEYEIDENGNIVILGSKIKENYDPIDRNEKNKDVEKVRKRKESNSGATSGSEEAPKVESYVDKIVSENGPTAEGAAVNDSASNDPTSTSGTHAASVSYADETLELLKSQLKSKGIIPLEFIPLADIKSEMASLMEKANRGEPFDDSRLDYLLSCMELNPEYQREKEAEAQKWRDEIGPYSRECLRTMRAFIPPSIFSCSVDSLVSDFGFSRDLAKRIMTKKCLWLIRINKNDIGRMHEAELMGRFNPESQGLDIIETAAIYAAIPSKFTKDGTGKKENWRLALEKNLKQMYQQEKAGSLLKIRKRSPAYANQTAQFTQRETLHQMNSVSSDGLNDPRQSFMNISGSNTAVNKEKISALHSPKKETPIITPDRSKSVDTGRDTGNMTSAQHTAVLAANLNKVLLSKRIPNQVTSSAASRI